MAAVWAWAMARPTALLIPWPRGPVVTSIPGVSWASGWPGVMLSTCYKLGCQQIIRFGLCSSWEHGAKTYTEGLQVVNGQGVSVQVQQSILKHTSVAVAGGLLRSAARHVDAGTDAVGSEGGGLTRERSGHG